MLYFTPKIIFFLLITVLYGCSAPPSPPNMMHTASGIIPLTPGEDPVKNMKGQPFNVEIEGFLSLKGVLMPEKSHTGESAEITLIWQVKDPAKLRSHKVFVHGQIAHAQKHQVSADHQLLQKKQGLEQIQAGDYLQDRFQLNIPSFFIGESLNVFVGIYLGKKRFKVSPDDAHDGQHRIHVGTLNIPGAHPSLPTINIPFTPEKITVDGKLDESFWKDAAQLSPFILYHGKRAARQQTRVSAAWTPQFLYLAFECDDTDIHTPYSKRDDPIYESEAVEIFIDANGDQDDYIELQAAPNDVQFDASFKGGRRKNFNTAYHNNYLVKTTRIGTLNDSSDKDKGWISEWKIPVADIIDADGEIEKNDTWRVNLFRLDRIRKNGKVRKSEASAWSSPLSGDFHNIARMGTFVFTQE